MHASSLIDGVVRVLISRFDPSVLIELVRDEWLSTTPSGFLFLQACLI